MISHHHQCIFVHVPKTAGQSIERVFLADLGLTWATRAPLLLRYNDTPAVGPPRLAHLKAPEYLHYCYVSPELFERYFKFTVVRNPWDRVVSMQRYLQPGTDLAQFVARLEQTLAAGPHWYVDAQLNFLTRSGGRLMVDYVARFETLASDFDAIRARAGIAGELPHANASDARPIEPGGQGSDGRAAQYRPYYDRATRDRVARLYARDIEAFGYRFEPVAASSRGTGS